MNQNQDEVRCQKCKSAKIHTEKRGWNVWLGFIGSGKIICTCLNCGHKFKPGEGYKAEPIIEQPSAKQTLDDGEIPTYRLD